MIALARCTHCGELFNCNNASYTVDGNVVCKNCYDKSVVTEVVDEVPEEVVFETSEEVSIPVVEEVVNTPAATIDEVETVPAAESTPIFEEVVLTPPTAEDVGTQSDEEVVKDVTVNEVTSKSSTTTAKKKTRKTTTTKTAE